MFLQLPQTINLQLHVKDDYYYIIYYYIIDDYYYDIILFFKNWTMRAYSLVVFYNGYVLGLFILHFI